jgi:hypothetical protein
MKRTEYTDEERASKKRQTETDYPQWTRQAWEDDRRPYVFEDHFVSLAIKHSDQDCYILDGKAKYGQILSASSGLARISLITTKSHCDSSSTNNDGIGIYFDVPLKLDVKPTDDVCFKLTIDGQEIETKCDRDTRFNKLRQVNKSSNMTVSHRNAKGSNQHTDTWTIKAIEVACHDSYTSGLYAALMHQYITPNKDRISSKRK